MKRKMVFLILASFFLSSCVGPSHVQTASVSLIGTHIRKIAVMDFEFDRPEREEINFGHLRRPRNAGSVMADVFAEKLLETDSYQLVERKQIKRILDEHGFSMAKLLDSTSLDEVNKILKLDGIVVGNVTEFMDYQTGAHWGGTVSFSARLLDMKTGVVIWSVSGESHHPLGGSTTAAHTAATYALKELMKKKKSKSPL